MGKAIANVFAILISVFRIAIIIIRQFFSAFSGGDGSGFLTFAFTLFKITQAIREFMVAAENAIKNVGLFQAVGDFIANVFICGYFRSIWKNLRIDKSIYGTIHNFIWRCKCYI